MKTLFLFYMKKIEIIFFHIKKAEPNRLFNHPFEITMSEYEHFAPIATVTAVTAETAEPVPVKVNLVDCYLQRSQLVMQSSGIEVFLVPQWATVSDIIVQCLNVHPERPFTPQDTPLTFAYFKTKFEKMLLDNSEHVYTIADSKFINAGLITTFMWHIYRIGLMFSEMGPLLVQRNDNGMFLVHPPERSTDDIDVILANAPAGAFTIRPSQGNAGKIGISYKHSDDNDVHHVLSTHHYMEYNNAEIQGSIWTIKEEGTDTLEPYPTLTELIISCSVLKQFQCSTFDENAESNFEYDKERLLTLPQFADVAADVARAREFAAEREAALAAEAVASNP